MAVLNMFRRSQDAPPKMPNAAQVKTTQRLNQITQSVCRRGEHNDVKCSPYAPCYDVCPVITPPPGREPDMDGPSLEELAAELSSLK